MTHQRLRHLACLKGIEKDAAEDYLIMYQTTEKKETEIEELSGDTGLGLGLRDFGHYASLMYKLEKDDRQSFIFESFSRNVLENGTENYCEFDKEGYKL